ncbi:hypothetical protein V8E52_009736 [Russula decolorans]
MTSEHWQVVGAVASTAGVTTFAIGGAKGIVAGYQTYASPYTSLTEAGRKLKRVRSRLQGLSPKRREEIEIATRSESFNDSSLEVLEGELENLTDMHCRLSKRIEETTFRERYFPYSEFRSNLKNFERHARALLNDTLKTTVPCIDDIEFKPENSTWGTKRPSSSESIPENSRCTTERSSSSKSKFNPENSTPAMERPSCSESAGYVTARESFSDIGGVLLYWRNVLV